jgi:hypothetical protein
MSICSLLIFGQAQLCARYTFKSFNFFPGKHVRCNPDVAPRLTSGGYEDKVDVITPINILFIGDGKF